MGKRGNVPDQIPETDKSHLIETLTSACSNMLARYLSDPDTAHSEAAAALKTLTALEPECRAVFIMHRFLDLDYGVIARRLEIPVAAVETHMAQALLQLTVNIEVCKPIKENHNAV